MVPRVEIGNELGQRLRIGDRCEVLRPNLRRGGTDKYPDAVGESANICGNRTRALDSRARDSFIEKERCQLVASSEPPEAFNALLREFLIRSECAVHVCVFRRLGSSDRCR